MYFLYVSFAMFGQIAGNRAGGLLASDCDTIPALANYARTKAQAMRKRASGAILEVLKLERECERIYQRLPEPLKW
jgi:hypothetical protein